ncbi:MAG: exosortase/archaeosortase family protein [Nitrospirae bacterium]|nr:exosortase/archaeosortase family protein [Nitrospirota bacterium]MDA1303480.1 exosortase/archaeosortase family protein [Nitrospirota bacterium]
MNVGLQQQERESLGMGFGLALGTILLGLMVALYHEIFAGLLYDWDNDPNYSHGFIVPFMSAYFVYERWGQLRTLPIQPNMFGIPILILGVTMLIIGSVGAELFAQRVSFIGVIIGLILLILGRRILITLSLPIVFLLFMIPLPAIVVNTIAFPLQIFAAQTASFCLFNLGIPVLREGNLISLAGTTLEVAEACSGLRSLVALLALGTVYAYFSQRQMWKRWALVLLSIPIAIIANAFRVTGTGILANYWGAEAAEGFYHTFEGWIVFVVAFILLLGCGILIAKIGKQPQHHSATRL